MADVKWTDEQRQAIEERGKGIIVSAAAGSGKTAVLIQRMIDLLSDEKNKIPADRLLAVTFTNEAAAQMRDKLAQAFEEKLRREPDNKWLLSQQNLLQLAKVCTIDSFCLDLVKSNLQEFDFQGGISILDESIQNMIYDQAQTAALERLCQEDYESYKLLNNAVDVNGNIIKGLYDFLRSLPFPKRWINYTHRNFTDDAVFEGFVDNLFEQMKRKLDKAQVLYEKFEALARYENDFFKLSDYSKILETVLDDGESIGEIRKKIEARDIDFFAKYPKNDNLARIKPLSKTSKVYKSLEDDIKMMLSDSYETAKACRDSYKSILAEIFVTFNVTEDMMKENMLFSDRIFTILCNVCDYIEEFSHEEKLERNGLTFSDVEIMARDLLVIDGEDGIKRTELCEEIRNNRLYEVIFIDEFQDVNNLQELVFRLLSDTDNIEIMGKNVFVVGDIKQAIYRFRLSNPELFNKTKRDAQNEANKDQLISIKLSKNFRSRRCVIDFVNYLFHNLMTQDNGDVDYTEDEELRLGAGYVGEDKPTEIILIKDDRQYSKLNGYSTENYAVAQKIKSMIASGEKVDDHGTLRNCRPGDFCILTQTNKGAAQAAKALEAVGLKAYSEDTDGYLKSREISLVLSMLKIIDNPMNDVAMAAVMMSPVFEFSPDEMAAISQRTKIEGSRLRNHIYQVVAAAGSAENGHEKEAEHMELGNEKLQQKCIKLNKFLGELRYLSMSMGLERFIRKIYDMTDLMGVVSLYLDSDKKRANLRLLLEYAAAYEENSQEGVTGLLRYIKSVETNEKAFKQAMTITEGSDSVYIKTFHASKGLEYPFVFLCQLDIPLVKNQNSFKSHNEYGFAFKFKDKEKLIEKTSVYYENLRMICDNEEKSEKLRLLYVACTRAKERLFICCAPQHSKSNTTYDSYIEKKVQYIENAANLSTKAGDTLEKTAIEANTMLDWVMLALSLHKQKGELLDWLGGDTSVMETCDYIQPELVYNEYSVDTKQDDQAEEQQISFAAVNNQLVRELLEKFDSKYDMKGSETPAKMTVTEITAAEKEKEYGEKNPEFYPNLPRLDDELDKLTAAERGTFTHKFMELADYEKAKADTESELARLVEKGFFTQKEADGVYLEALKAFFASDFFGRMNSSEKIMREKKFLVSIADLDLKDSLPDISGQGGMIQGIADCIFKEPDGYVLVDYKTDRFGDISELMGYKTQLALYKAAFELILGEKIKSSYIYSFWLRKGVEIPL
ncbi:UvrD-helicase domain-containing protein [Ruminococcus sp.]|uniref:UvrD-helicase domain-containing protein n=1 Tax=Ruminococcus sp. TaxID=41978 RepID=UPI0025D708B0|nr:UvrD-helicase domain-containing protein [Ruminococcus sp.]